MWMWINQLDFEWTEKNRTKSQPTWFKPKINLLLFESWSKNCNEILYSGGTFLFAYRTVPPRCSLPFGVLAIRSGIWIFVFDEWGFGWGVRSEVSSQLHLQPVSNSTCTFYFFSPAPSFNCRFPLRSTVSNHRFLHADGTSDGTLHGLGEERTTWETSQRDLNIDSLDQIYTL